LRRGKRDMKKGRRALGEKKKGGRDQFDRKRKQRNGFARGGCWWKEESGFTKLKVGTEALSSNSIPEKRKETLRKPT